MAVVAVVAVVYAMRSGDEAPNPVQIGDPGIAHVHGLGINPANGELYAATHTGLFRITKQGERTRIADRHQDTMWFTVVGPDHFLASGHPDLREELPPLLGLLESKDAGRTWTKKSLLGKADFHALRYAHRLIYGYDSTGGAFMVSRDGRRWDTRSSITLRDFVVSPDNRDSIVATTGRGLVRSSDGGRTWDNTEAPSGSLLLDWAASDALFLMTSDGTLYRSGDSARSWDRRGRVSGQPEAFVSNGDALYVAIGSRILTSTDGGQTWETFFSEDH